MGRTFRFLEEKSGGERMTISYRKRIIKRTLGIILFFFAFYSLVYMMQSPTCGYDNNFNFETLCPFFNLQTLGLVGIFVGGFCFILLLIYLFGGIGE